MRRDFEAFLRAWRQRADRKPLVVKGARQTGKTYVLERFGAAEYAAVHVLNFEAGPRLATVFEGELDPVRLVRDLALLGRFDPHAVLTGAALLFFDEIQACPRALTSLKYFAEQLPEVHIVAAGSLLGVELSRAASFPVGKVQLHTLHPLDFFEFLDATGRDAYRARLEVLSALEPLPAGIHAELIAALREYLVVGGMPEAVAAFSESRDFARARQIQKKPRRLGRSRCSIRSTSARQRAPVRGILPTTRGCRWCTSARSKAWAYRSTSGRPTAGSRSGSGHGRCPPTPPTPA